MSRPIIEARGVSKRYQLGAIGAKTLREELERAWSRVRGRTSPSREASDFWALRDVSFDVQAGEVLGIIGRNGAGKSTLLKILSRITQQTAGEITLRGRVACLLEVGTGFHPDLTGRENVFLNGAILGMSKSEVRRKFDEIVAFAEIDQFIDTPVKRYSSGMYVRLAFAVAAHLEPEVLIVDEVLAVGDVAFQKKCLGRMSAVSGEGPTVLFVSHNLRAVQRLCQRCILLSDGRVRADGPSEAVVNQYVLETGESAQVPLDQREDRVGTGIVRFISVRMTDADGHDVKAFRCGADAVIVLNIENRTGRDLEAVVIGLGVDDPMGQRITLFTNDSTTSAPMSIARDVSAIQLCVDRLPLLPGRYGFTLYLAVAGQPADWIQNAGYFDIDSGDDYGTGTLPHGQGHLLVDHHFSLVRTNPDRRTERSPASIGKDR